MKKPQPILMTLHINGPNTKPLDMAVRGPKAFPALNRVWSRAHTEQVVAFRKAREEARRKYGRS